ncbi:sigma 54-interacting transcriptional regulator [Alteribacillus sp. YIM 98480]|uniref:sigma 54-interacting transcriptional regulator n=1 Tax=Alteribacillus sp. YIM 98480 TaxID=2606599 RepID=UPI00131CF8A5|nr:sigma 54-interacting transcriptional regulator [Alteribacillus sp. YIM 98480]
MPMVMKEKLHPLFCISVDPPEKEWKAKLSEHKEPFIFLKSKGSVYAFVYSDDLRINTWSDPEINVETLITHAHSLDNVGILKPEENTSLPFIFQTLGEPIALAKDEHGEYLGYMRREDLLVELFRQENQNSNLLKTMLSSIPMGIFVVDKEKKFVNCNEAGLKMINSSYEKIMGADAEVIFNNDHLEKVFISGETVLNQIQFTNDMGILVDFSPILNNDGQVDGIMIIVQDLPMVEEMAMEIEYVKDLNADLNAILTSMYDEILVVNHKGEILRYSDNFISDFWETDLKELLGENLLALEDKGEFSPSVARLVIDRQEKVSVVQETKNGKNVFAVGNPVFNEKGELHRIVIASRDITETTRLKSELQETKRLSKKYKKELENLKSKDQFAKKIIYQSTKMEQIMIKIEKLAEFNSTVLILGESGVGKELIAESIHQYGSRSNQPFLKINCGAIPEDLLESELFGYTKGAFTGADTRGKTGYFQKADKGVLLLDEIGEIPQRLQVKLLRVLQEKEITPVGSTQSIPVDVQIITATNKNLEKMVADGTFREDLFYRINVIPITIPPLRERPEDVPLLAFHFLKQLNEQYGKNYHLSPEALNVLEVYPWPGNIRELQNLIERFVVSAEEDVISADFVSPFLNFGKSGSAKPLITDIMPYQQAQESVEEQLILLAMKKYKTTSKAAKALKISQSAVSRKYQKILQRQQNNV